MSKRPASSYPVEFFDIWRLATAGTLSLTFPARNTAVNFKHRLYAFRRRLIEEGHPEASAFYEADLDIQTEIETTGNGESALVRESYKLVPYTPDWKRQLRDQAQSVQPPVLGGEPFKETEQPQETFEEALNKFIKD